MKAFNPKTLTTMKRLPIIFLTTALMLILIAIIPPAMAQEPPHPPTIGHGQKGNQNPGNAPVGSGILILISLGMTYAGKKVLQRNEDDQE
jgi:hypothetical protein